MAKRKKPSHFPLIYGAVLLGLGGLLTTLVTLAETGGVDADMPAWAAVLYTFLGPWGIFAAFAAPAGLLWLSYALQWLELLPLRVREPLERALNMVTPPGIVVGGTSASVLCFTSGHWFFGSLLGLVVAVGALFVLAAFGAQRAAVTLSTGLVLFVVLAGIPAMLAAFTYESWVIDHDGRVLLGAILLSFWLAAEAAVGLAYVRGRMRGGERTKAE